MRRYKTDKISLDNQRLMLEETLFHNANGYIGVRGNFEEGYPSGYDSIRGQYINGFYDFAKMPQAEKLYGLIEEKQTIVNVVDTQGVELAIDGETFSMFEGTIEKSSRSLEMDQGVTIREIIWKSPRGKRVAIEIKRMTSFEVLPLFLIDYKVTPLNFDGEVSFCSTHNGNVRNYFNPEDPRVAGESLEHLTDISSEVMTSEKIGSFSMVTAHTANSNLSVCSSVYHKIVDEEQTYKNIQHKRKYLNIVGGCQEDKDIDEKTSSIVFEKTRKEALESEEITLYVSQDKPVRLLKYTIICDSIRYGEDNPDLTLQKETCKLLEEVVLQDVEVFYQKQKGILAEFWNSCQVEIIGDDELNQAVSYNLYQLVQSVGKDPHSNIAAKGLSGEGYEGHYFWDTEMYIQPFFTLTSREIAKNLIRYRYTTLDYARENAKLLGHKKGAAYPWRTIMGKECSGFFPAGSAQYHISGDIAYAIIKYYLATKDIEIVKECGVEILIEVSRLWLDMGNYYQGLFHLNEVTGPDEYTCLVNNNYYTNALAKFGLAWTVKLIRILEAKNKASKVIRKTGLTEEELVRFQEASDKMYLPYDEETGINPQDDSFLQKKMWDVSTITPGEKPLLMHYHPMHLYRYQIIKQADTVLAHFILEDMQDTETIRKSFEYYEKVTTHDSSLSTCIYSIVAAKLGLVDKAYQYFGESAKLDLFNTHKNTKDGIHTANMGGTYMAIVYGFGGVRIKEDGLHINPVLPKEWQEYSFRLLYENSKIEVKVNEDGCKLTLLVGEPTSVWLGGELFQLT
jgi:alpha,alpha-trehalose phosphorylase